MSKMYDLDALVPDSVTIKIDNQEIALQQPGTGQMLRLSKVGQQLQDAESMTPEQIEQAEQDLKAAIVACVPELADKQLNTTQLTKLMLILSDMVVPPDTKELEARGIKIGDTEKKAQ